ncbi:unnamed protein product [Closterium sp. Naga37s-1]|nr:unnamed protein product [Closterium sp. Naga37s-1]
MSQPRTGHEPDRSRSLTVTPRRGWFTKRFPLPSSRPQSFPLSLPALFPLTSRALLPPPPHPHPSAFPVLSSSPSPRVRAAFERWSDAATWGGGDILGQGALEGANVTIPCGKAVLLDTSPVLLTLLNIQGVLMYSPPFPIPPFPSPSPFPPCSAHFMPSPDRIPSRPYHLPSFYPLLPPGFLHFPRSLSALSPLPSLHSPPSPAPPRFLPSNTHSSPFSLPPPRFEDTASLPQLLLNASFILLQGRLAIGAQQQHFSQRAVLTLTPNPSARAPLLVADPLPADAANPRNLGHKALAVARQMDNGAALHAPPPPLSLPPRRAIGSARNARGAFHPLLVPADENGGSWRHVTAGGR